MTTEEKLEKAIAMLKEANERNYGHLVTCEFPHKLFAKCTCGAEKYKEELEKFMKEWNERGSC